MATYLLAYHGGGMPETEEQQAQVVAAWAAWYEELGAAIVDGGNPVGAWKTMASDGSVSAGGGANPITGYTVISASGMEEATELSRGCPILGTGGSIEICETFDVM
jgi:hypothetical protein